MHVYKEPLYYEIAFSFVDAKKQIGLFEKFIKRFSKINVNRVLDIGCGPSLQLRELAKKEYKTVGVDSSQEMLEYIKKKSKEDGTKIETIKADFKDFRLKNKADFAIILMGTISYVRKKHFLRHLDSVASSLRKGGLYIIENFRLNYPQLLRPQQWTMRKDGIKIKAIYSVTPTRNKKLKENIRLYIDDKGRKIVLQENSFSEFIPMKEFLKIMEINGKFEFIGIFDRHKLQRLKKSVNNNIIILRRK